MNREMRNYQFDFLKPQHSNFSYFKLPKESVLGGAVRSTIAQRRKATMASAGHSSRAAFSARAAAAYNGRLACTPALPKSPREAKAVLPMTEWL